MDATFFMAAALTVEDLAELPDLASADGKALLLIVS